MKSFPIEMRVENIHNFTKINYDRVTDIMRQEIYNTILNRKSENDYIDLDSFAMKYLDNKICIVLKIIDTISKELNTLGWKTKLSFGDTGLFIYSTENPPTSCW